MKSTQDLINTITTLQSDVMSTRDLKSKVDQTVQDTITATRIIDGFRNPQQHGSYLKNYATFPLEYVLTPSIRRAAYSTDNHLSFFMRITEQMRNRLQWYKATIEVRVRVHLRMCSLS